MKLINLLFLLLPVFLVGQVDTSNIPSKWIKEDTILSNRWTTEWKSYNNTYTKTVKGKQEVSINVMHSDLKVEVVETRDTIYECPVTYGFTLLVYDRATGTMKAKDECWIKEVVTNRRYKMYVINEYGEKEYLTFDVYKRK